MTNLHKLLLIIWFYIGWFGCVFFARWDVSGLSFIFPGLAFIVFYRFKFFSKRQLFYFCGLAALGIFFDTLAYHLDWIQFVNYKQPFIPYWLMAMWFLFSAVFPLTQTIFKSNLVLAGLLGAVFGPLSYYSGEVLQVLSFTNHFAILFFAIFWGVYFPTAIYFYRKLI